MRVSPKDVVALGMLAERLATTRSTLAGVLLEAAIAEAMDAYDALGRNEPPVEEALGEDG